MKKFIFVLCLLGTLPFITQCNQKGPTYKCDLDKTKKSYELAAGYDDCLALNAQIITTHIESTNIDVSPTEYTEFGVFESNFAQINAEENWIKPIYIFFPYLTPLLQPKQSPVFNKTGSGTHAPILWQRGHTGAVIDYCLQDVALTAKLFRLADDWVGRLESPTDGADILLAPPYQNAWRRCKICGSLDMGRFAWWERYDEPHEFWICHVCNRRLELAVVRPIQIFPRMRRGGWAMAPPGLERP